MFIQIWKHISQPSSQTQCKGQHTKTTHYPQAIALEARTGRTCEMIIDGLLRVFTPLKCVCVCVCISGLIEGNLQLFCALVPDSSIVRWKFQGSKFKHKFMAQCFLPAGAPGQYSLAPPLWTCRYHHIRPNYTKAILTAVKVTRYYR